MFDPNIDKNYLGTFVRMKDVLAAYPDGGQKGDYLYVGETLYRWDKWNLSWVADGVTAEASAKRIHTFDGEVDIDEELHVGGDAVFNGSIRVNGTVVASRVKQPSVGLFASLQALQKAYPNPSVGMWATIGDTMPSPIYRCTEAGKWEATGEVGGVDQVERDLYYTKQEADEAMQRVAQETLGDSVPTKVSQLTNDSGYQTLADVQNAMSNKVDKVEGKGLSTEDFTTALKEKLESLPDPDNGDDSPEQENSENFYGVEWDTAVSATAMTRLGNMALHRSLPIQSKMRGCLLNDDGNVVEYLPVDDWTGATLDGSKGQVMVELPAHYRRFETDGTKRRCKMSEYPLEGYHLVPKMYISAYEATVQRSTTKLASVMNTSTDYRGGNNNSSWDGTYRSLLCRPATTISRTDFRAYARKRKPTTAEWNCQDYNAYKAVFWLYYLEYANRNCQLDFNGAKDSNGYAQGGLGKGVSTMLDSDWGSYNSYCPFVPCGHTNKLGNGSGEVAYVVKKEDGSTLATVYANRYRGIEHPFGHLWKWTDGINIQINPTSANGGDNTSKVYVADDPAAYNDSNYDGYTMRGLEARSAGYVKELVFGEFGDIMPATVGGGSTTYWADYHYTNIPTATALRGVLFGGHASYGASAGFGYAHSHHTPSHASADIGSRLCFIPKK